MKGIGSTQSACVLLEQPVTLQQVAVALQGWSIAGQRAGMQSWEFSGPMLGLPFRPEVNGYIVIDCIDRPWPDDMGDPQGNPNLFGAWSMGFFGPCVHPGALARAAQQDTLWEEGRTMPQRQRAFLRIRSTYSIGAQPNQPVLPRDYQALPELVRVTEVALALLRVPGALCYFNPNGETLRGAAQLEEQLGLHRAGRQLPLDLWRNLRLYDPRDCAGWQMLDTVGMEQLDLMDHEAVYAINKQRADQVAYYLSVMTQRAVQGDVSKEGDTCQNTDRTTWRARAFSQGLFTPPRPTLRWFPQDGSKPPAKLTTDFGKPGGGGGLRGLFGR